MKIKLGHRYVDGHGEIVTIVSDNGSSQWPYKGSNGRTYREDGVFGSSSGSPFNLESEFKDEGAPSKLPTILTGLFWLAVIIGVIGFWGIAAVKPWQMIPGN